MWLNYKAVPPGPGTHCPPKLVGIVGPPEQSAACEWEKRIQSEKAVAEAEAVRQMALARARAQIEIITRITERIEAMRASGDAELTDVVALRMIEAMEEAVADDKVRDLVPQQAIGTLRQIQGWVNDRGEDR